MSSQRTDCLMMLLVNKRKKSADFMGQLHLSARNGRPVCTVTASTIHKETRFGQTQTTLD